MARSTPKRQTVKASDVSQNWGRLLEKVRSGQARLIVEEDGVPVVGFVSAADLERLAILEEERRRHLSLLDDLRDAFEDISEEELEEEVAKALSEVRSERRSTRGE